MPDVHALLSASSSNRWLHCTPAPRLEAQYPESTSVFAEEGTFCHSLGEMKIKRYLHERTSRPTSAEFDTEEADQITDIYSNFVISIIEEFKQNGVTPLVFVEHRVDYSFVAPSGFGTSDAIVIGDDQDGSGVLHICDLKAGRGVYVNADHNSQLMLYALGALHEFDYIYDIKKVRMSIIQPRLENIGTFEMSADDLKAWGESIKPIAKMAYEGKGEQHPGEWCRFCKAKAHCKACADEALALARSEFVDLDSSPLAEGSSESPSKKPSSLLDSQNDLDKTSNEPVVPVFKQPGLISNADIEKILPTLNRISSWIESVFAYVSSEAINHGVHWKGYKVVEGRSKRTFTDINAVAEAASDAGYTDIYKKELLSLTQLEKLMGKKKFKEILGNYVVKPPGKLTLVPEDDPREEVKFSADGSVDNHPAHTAADDFHKLE